MSNSLTRTRAVQLWFVGVAVAIAGGIVFGVTMTMSTGVLLVAGCLVPPAILLFLWRDDSSSPTAAEVIHADRRR